MEVSAEDLSLDASEQGLLVVPPWAHIDLGGPTMSDSDAGYLRKGPTGIATRTLVRFVLNS